jgi:hypothetical protein
MKTTEKADERSSLFLEIRTVTSQHAAYRSDGNIRSTVVQLPVIRFHYGTFLQNRVRPTTFVLIASLFVLTSLDVGSPKVQGRVSQRTAPSTNPILLVVDSTSTNHFGPYLGEILRTEGITAFQIEQLTNLSSSYLKRFSTVILTETTLSASHADMFATYVSAGGSLIAMRPDPQLSPFLGLTRAAGATSEGYILVNPSDPIGAGVTSQTLQFHGTADHYSLNGASLLATLYSDEMTATPYPAVVLNSYGAGRSATFTYDLARSVAYLRQGNPSIAGTDVDHDGVVRTVDGFEGGWAALDRIAIPQADEQQRLLANVLMYFGEQTIPVPRLWYFPTASENSVLLVTSDDHGQPTSTFGAMIDVAEQYGGRITFYLARSGQLNPASEQIWDQRGHEFGLHPYGREDRQSLDRGYRAALLWFIRQGYVGLSNTVRTHQANWQGWVDAAKIQQSYKIGLNVDYYLWGPWLEHPNGRWECTGYLNGSGLPMQFVDQRGQIIPVYQQSTHLVDEHMIGGTTPGGCRMDPTEATVAAQHMIDRSVAGYYSAVTMQSHTDYYFSATEPWLGNVLAYAQSKGVPAWTASRWWRFTQARHDATFNRITWSPDTNQLSFHYDSLISESTSTLLLPATHKDTSLESATVDGVPKLLGRKTVSGLTYGTLGVATGSHDIVLTYD